MTERVATGEIYIGLHDEETLAGLRKIEKDFDRTMNKIDRTEAEATISADTKKLERKLQDATHKLNEYERKKRKAEGAEIGGLQRAINLQKEKVALARKEWEAARKNLEAHRKENEALKFTDLRLAAIEQREKRMEVLRKQAHNKEMQRLRAIERMNDRAAAQRMKEKSDWDRMHAAMERELRTVPKLEAAYVRMHDRLDKLAAAKRSARGDKASIWRIEFDEEQTRRSINDLGNDIRRIAHRDPIDIPLRRNMGDRWGRELRYEFDRAGGHLPTTAALVGTRIGRRLGSGIAQGTRDTLDRGLSGTLIHAGRGLGRTIGGGALRGLQRIGHAAGNLADMTVRLGPFTASIRQAFIGLSLLAPILLDVAGAAGSLVGSLGAATLGLGALGIAVAGGAIPAFIGMGIVIKQVATEFKQVMTAKKAYDDALRKGNTDLAKDKMKEMRAIMGNVSKETVRQVGLAGDLNAAWKKATEPSRAAVFTTIGQGLKTASDLMPMFAKNTNEAMQVASDGVNDWMKSLRSAEGSRILDTMMDNFTRALGPALDGLGSLIGYLGKVGAIASKSLPGLARTFRDWAEGVNSVDAGELENKVEGVIESAKNMGRFFLSAGRLVKAFFGGGVEAGDDFIHTMTEAMNRWRKGFTSPEGRNDLENFFSEGVEGTQAFYNALKPVLSSFVQWSRLMAPWARLFFDTAAAVGRFVDNLLDVTGLRGPVAALVATLGGLWALGKIQAATMAVGNFARALLGLGKAQATLTATSRGSAILGAGSFVSGTALTTVRQTAPAAEKAAASVGRLGRAGSIAARGLSGIGMALTGLSNPWVGGAILGGALALAFIELTDTTEDWKQSMEAADAAARKADAAARKLGDSYAPLAQQANAVKDANRTASDAQREVNRLLDDGKRGTDAYRTAVRSLNDAILARDQAAAQQTRDLRAQNRDLVTSVREYTTQLREAKEQRDQLGDEELQLDPLNALEDVGDDAKNLADAFRLAKGEAKEAGMTLEKYLSEDGRGQFLFDEGGRERVLAYGDALAEIQDAEKGLRGQALAVANISREFKGMAPIAAKAADAVDYLNRKLGGKKTQQISLKFRGAEDATRVAQSAARSLRAGVPKSVTTRLVANSSNADAAVRALQRAQLTPKRLEIIETGGDKAINMLEQIMGRKLTKKEQVIAEKGGDLVLDKLRAIGTKDLPRKTQETQVRGDGTVLSALERIARFIIPAKKAEVRKSDPDGILGFLADVTSKINQIPTRTDHTIYVHQSVDGDVKEKFYASGRRDGAAAPNAIVGEGADFKGAKEHIVDTDSGTVRTVDGPMPIALKSSDAVIPTEPRFRDRGRSIFREIAADLGLPRFAGGKGKGGKGKGKGAGPTNPALPPALPEGIFSQGDFLPGTFVAPTLTYEAPNTKPKAFKSQDAWAAYVTGLQTQQSYWEREVSIRESQVREPAEMVVRDREHDTKILGPDGKPTGEVIEAYKANPDIEDKYKPDLAYVIEAMRQLVVIVQELVRAIPQAIRANQHEAGLRQETVGYFEGQIKKRKKDIKGYGDGKKGKKAKADAEDDIRKWEKKVQENREEISVLNDDAKLYGESRVEAGFALREANIALRDREQEYNTVFNIADTQAENDTAENLKNASSSGSSGSSSGGISYGEQKYLADTEKASVLREFGSNFSPVGGGRAAAAFAAGAAAVGGAVGAMASRPTTGFDLGAPSSGVADLRAASAAVGSSQAASGAVAMPSGTGGGAAASSAAAPVPGPTQNVVVNNTFANVPPDPHTWARGIEFEIGAIV